MSERSNGPVGSSGADAAEPHPIEVGEEPFPLTGTDDDPHEERTPPSRTRKIVLSTLLALSVAGAAVIGYTAWQISSEKDATLTTPQQIAGLSIDDSESGRQTAEYLTTALSADVDFDRAVGAVYTDPARAERSVLFFGGTALIWAPGSDLETAFDLVADDQGAVTDVKDVDAGKLGGTMRCGSTKSDDGDISVCGWADHGSLALALFPNRPVNESAALMRDIRTGIQTRQ